MRKIEIPLNEILSLISCAEDYAFNSSVLMCAFAKMLNKKLSDEEIENYAKTILNHPDYGQEEYEEIKDKLIEFKQEHCK